MSELPILRLQAYFADPKAPGHALQRGSRGPFVRSLRQALLALRSSQFDPHLPSSPPDEQLYDESLETAIRAFQSWQQHSSKDGVFGPGTRRLLAQQVWEHCGPRFLSMLEPYRPDPRPRAFLSHSSSDASTVEQIEAFLHNHSVQVVRYTYSFIPGHSLDQEIQHAVALADKVIVFRSDRSLASRWVLREIQLATELEEAIHQEVLLYVLKAAVLSADDEKRIVIQGAGRRLREVGDELLRALYGPTGPPQRPYDPDMLL